MNQILKLQETLEKIEGINS